VAAAAAAATLAAVRRLALLVAAPLLFAAPARAATIEVSPKPFSPARGALPIRAALSVDRAAGLELATPAGRKLGWIVRPARRRSLALDWDGTLAGTRVPDGAYLLRLVWNGSTLASARIRLDRTAPALDDLRVDNGGSPFAGDSRWLATISPNGDGFRDAAFVRFTLAEPATVTMQVARTVTTPTVIWQVTERLGRGRHALEWAPTTPLNPRTYLVLLKAVDAAGNTISYGARNAFTSRWPRGPVIRLQGIDAGFTDQSYAPGQIATLRIATDAPLLTERVFHSGPEQVVVYADNQMAGVEVDAGPQTLDWSEHRDAPAEVQLTVGNWPSGLYYVQLTDATGRTGYAPFVVRPAVLGAQSRIAVILPTNTWQAYNYYDVAGNGYGDTWYAGGWYSVDLSRPYNNKGVPPRFYRYDLPFLHWLYWSGRGHVDFLADSDLARIRSGDDLAAGYDLIVFEGHEEYATQHMFDLIERYRDLGGNLIFLSANNFFWRVSRQGTVLRKTGQFRQVSTPEASVIGVQYRANDDGQKRGLYVVQNAEATPWLWEDTGLTDGSTFGGEVGGYGIEIDATAPESPPGTIVVAQVPDLYGPGLTAQMSYYETPAGAKVFAAGALNFGGSVSLWPMKRILDNVWDRLAQP
jgi:hypothetical protein